MFQIFLLSSLVSPTCNEAWSKYKLLLCKLLCRYAGACHHLGRVFQLGLCNRKAGIRLIGFGGKSCKRVYRRYYLLVHVSPSWFAALPGWFIQAGISMINNREIDIGRQLWIKLVEMIWQAKHPKALDRMIYYAKDCKLMSLIHRRSTNDSHPSPAIIRIQVLKGPFWIREDTHRTVLYVSSCAGHRSKNASISWAVTL